MKMEVYHGTNGWLIVENPINMDDWVYPHFRKPPNLDKLLFVFVR